MDFFNSFNESLVQFLLYVGPVIPFAIVFGCSLGFFFYLISCFIRFICRRYIWKERDD